MSFEWDGYKEIKKELDSKYSEANVRRVTDEALIDGGNMMLRKVKSGQAKYQDYGNTYREAKLSDIMRVKDQAFVTIYWSGSHNRWSIVHLQEYGHYNKDGTFNNTDSKGLLQRTLLINYQAYFRTIQESLRRSL